MFHSLDRASERRATAALVAGLMSCLMALSLLVAPSAPAEPLDDRRDRVRKELRQAERHLNHSTTALQRAARKVEAAESRLTVARRALSRRRDALDVAAVLDDQRQAELDTATERLERAQEAVAQARLSHQAQEDVLRHIAARTYQIGSPTLLGVSMVLSSQDPSELTSQLSSVQTVLDKESATLRRLEASRMLLSLQEERVVEAIADVVERREAAAETLRRRQVLETRAAAAAQEVTELVAARTVVKRKAAKAKKADQRQVRQLRKERRQIEKLLRKRAAAERRRSRKAVARKKEASRSRTAPMLMPVDTYVTSRYGMRLHPIFRQWRLHDGTDFGASCGRAVRAAANGRVIGKYYNSGYGNRVIISHGYLRGAAVSTTYNHLRGYSTYVGQRVRRGDVIGFVGSTGYSTGCHLHFMVFRNGRTVDPMRWLR